MIGIDRSRSGEARRRIAGWTRWWALHAAAALTLCAVVGGWAPGAAQEMSAPMDLQITTLMKVLEFDRNLHDRVGREVVVGVLFQTRFRASANARAEAEEVFAEQGLTSLQGIPLRIVFIDVGEGGDLERAFQTHGLDFLYVTPLRAFQLDRIISKAQGLDIPTLTGVPEFVRDGLGIGISVQGRKLKILVNLPSCRAEGMDLSSELLKLAEVIR